MVSSRRNFTHGNLVGISVGQENQGLHYYQVKSLTSEQEECNEKLTHKKIMTDNQ